MEVLGSFTCRKAGTWDRFFHFPSEGRDAEDFSDARKIQRLRRSLNPRTRVPEASVLTTRPPKPSRLALRTDVYEVVIFNICVVFEVKYFQK